MVNALSTISSRHVSRPYSKPNTTMKRRNAPHNVAREAKSGDPDIPDFLRDFFENFSPINEAPPPVRRRNKAAHERTPMKRWCQPLPDVEMEMEEVDTGCLPDPYITPQPSRIELPDVEFVGAPSLLTNPRSEAGTENALDLTFDGVPPLPDLAQDAVATRPRTRVRDRSPPRRNRAAATEHKMSSLMSLLHISPPQPHYCHKEGGDLPAYPPTPSVSCF